MPETNQDFDLYQGDDHTIRFSTPNTDDFGDVVDMSGAVVTWKLMKDAKRSTIYLTKQSPSGITVSEETDTIICDVAVSASDTELLSRFGKLYHELEFKLATGKYRTVSTGVCNFIRTGVANA